jgi:hypothetical protein
METAEIDTDLIEDLFSFRKARELELSGSVDPLCANIEFADWLIDSHFYVIRFDRGVISIFSTAEPDDIYESFEQFIIEFATWSLPNGELDSSRPKRAIDTYRSFARSDALI